MVKAIAERRGRRHRHHVLTARIVKRLAIDARDAELPRLFKVAEKLHINFYENRLSETHVRAMAQDVSKLVQRLQAIYDA